MLDDFDDPQCFNTPSSEEMKEMIENNPAFAEFVKKAPKPSWQKEEQGNEETD